MRHPVAVLLVGLLAVMSCRSALAQNTPIADSGLDHPFRLAIGPYSAFNSDSGGDTGEGWALKADYTFFRPTRHEAMASLWYGHASGEGGHGWWAGTAEYRWRFGGHGIAFYGLGLGLAASTESGGPSGAAFTGVLGVEIGRFSIESRSLAVGGEMASLLMVGYRF